MSKEPTTAEIKDILRLPDGPEGDEKLEKLLAGFGEEFTQRERLFILFYTNPLSKTCGKVSRSGAAAGGSFKSWGDWVVRQPHVRKRIDEINNSNAINEIEKIFLEDIRYCQQVLKCDRTSFKKDNHVELEDKDIEFDVIDDKKIEELSAAQRKMVSDFEYDKNGKAHYKVETRASARQALANYYKLFTQKLTGADDKKTETVVTLEAIKDKALAKVSIIQHNNAEAELAGDFIDSMKDIDEEA